MSRRLVALRLALAAAAISALAACASPTAPTSSNLRVPSVNHDGAIDGTPSDCRSGYSVSQGRSC